MRSAILVVAVLGISGCANTEGGSASSGAVDTGPYVAITDQAEFNSLIVDKTLVKGGNTWIIKSDGSLGGAISGESVSGTWVWDGTYCREASWGSTSRPYNCQKIEKNGTDLRFTQISNGSVSDGWKVSE